MASSDQSDPDKTGVNDATSEVVQSVTRNRLTATDRNGKNGISSKDSTDSDESVQSDREEDADAGAQGNDADRAPPIPRSWRLHRQELERIAAAIERASAVTDEIDKQYQPPSNVTEHISMINLSFRRDVWYKIPGDACRTWKRMETLLRTWFQHDEKGLRDFERGNYTLKSHREFILPQIWEKVLSDDDNISFSRTPPAPPPLDRGAPYIDRRYDSASDSSSSTRPTSPVPLPRAKPESKYESRIRYTIKYMRQKRYGSGYESETALNVNNTFDEPVAFELDSFQDDLPALEEIQEVVAPRDAPRQRRVHRGYDDSAENDEKKIKLRPYHRLGRTRLKLNSLFLLNVIRSVVSYSSKPPMKDTGGLTDGIFEHPYKDLYLNLEAIEDYKLSTNPLRMRHSSNFNSKFDEHLELLQKYLVSRRDIPFDEARSKWAKSKPVTSFALIWLLLKPGTDVYVRENDGSLNAYIVDSVEGGVTIKEGRRSSSSYLVVVWHLVYGGSTISPRTTTIEINVYDNDREISSLPVFPVRFRDDADSGETRRKLTLRGQKYFKYSQRPSFLQYSGKGLKAGKSYKRARVVVEHASRPWESFEFDKSEYGAYQPMGINLRKRAKRARVIVDSSDEDEADPIEDGFGSSRRIARCECQECQDGAVAEDVHAMPFSDYFNIDPQQIGALTDHKYMLMSSHMFAFILKDRKYDLLDVDFLEEVELIDTAIDKLVMDTGNKDIVKAIAKIYTATDTETVHLNKESSEDGTSELGSFKRFSADFISGKGEGQIILLHGPPGTGKTLTAESVAEYTKRPLLSITAADLGHEPEILERRLLRYFRRATDWDAIVLLDEADVYLEQRSVDDLPRNSIVSVFLRAMDYFQGILFLTTNRVGQFDEAFASRIHLSLGYKKLDDKARGQIWDNLFQKIQDDYRKKIGPRIEFSIGAKEFVKLKRVMDLQWNGREIRNAFQTAVALAVYDATYKNGGAVPYLTESYFEQVVAMSTAFKDYMKDTHQGMTESERAAFYKLRSDSPGKSRPTRGRLTAHNAANTS